MKDRSESKSTPPTGTDESRIFPGPIGHRGKQLSPVVQSRRQKCERNGFQWKPCTHAPQANRRSIDQRTARSDQRTDSRLRHRHSSRRFGHASHHSISMKGKPGGVSRNRGAPPTRAEESRRGNPVARPSRGRHRRPEHEESRRGNPESNPSRGRWLENRQQEDLVVGAA